MALTSNYAMPENWTALNVARKQKQQCAKDVQDIKTTCQAEHNTKHVAECRECFDKVLDRMFSRYKDNTDREWFLGRISVASSLEMIFTEAKERKATFNDIEENIGSEKEAWYRSVLRRHPEFLAVAQSGVDIDEVRALLDDPDRSRTELVAEVSKAVGMPKDWSDQVDKFAAEVAATEGDPAGLKQLYVREFFKDRDTGETLPHAQPYLDMYERDDSMTLEDVMDKITSARQEDRSIQAQLEKHQNRLDELKRAKMAFEQSRAQAKSKAQGAQGPQPNKQYYDLQCVVCGGQPKEPGQWNSCIVCQTIFEIGGDAPLRVRCSDECAGKDEVSKPWICASRLAHDYRTPTHLRHTAAALRSDAYGKTMKTT